MFAVIRTGGKQYKVAPQDVIWVERLMGEPGAVIELGEVLLMGDGKATTVGTPLVEGARVAATVLEQAKGEKVIIFKKKRRQGYHRTRGHRQNLTVLRITEILAAGQARTATPEPAKAAEAAPAEGEAKPRRRAAAKTAASGGTKKPAAKRAKKPAAETEENT